MTFRQMQRDFANTYDHGRIISHFPIPCHESALQAASTGHASVGISGLLFILSIRHLPRHPHLASLPALERSGAPAQATSHPRQGRNPNIRRVWHKFETPLQKKEGNSGFWSEL